MKAICSSLSIIAVLSIGFVGCGDSNSTAKKSSSVNKSDEVVALVNETVKIFEGFGDQLESSLASGNKQNEIINDLKTIHDRYKSRMDVEIGSEFTSLEETEIRAYYYAIAGQEAEKHDAVDPQIRQQVERLKGLSDSPTVRDTPMTDHVKGYVISFLNHCGSMASTAILEAKK